jgi:hypothetical protein
VKSRNNVSECAETHENKPRLDEYLAPVRPVDQRADEGLDERIHEPIESYEETGTHCFRKRASRHRQFGDV